MNRGIFSSGYCCHRNQENGVFAVSMATVLKFICLFQKANEDKHLLKVSAQSNCYFLRKNVAICPIVPRY